MVSYDPEEQEADGAPTRRASRRSSRGRPTPQARGRRTVREGEEDLEEVRSTSRRRSMRGAPMQEEGDKISIEVGSVKALSTKYGIVRGMTWMVILSMLLWWVPVLGPATVGYVGGRKSGGPLRAAVAAIVPLLFVFGAVAVTTSSAENVPLAIRHYVSEGYQAVLGALPFEFPLLSYIFSNLAAVMASGPDALFTVLAFALVGGAVTQMRIHERSVPPITARLPKHRVVQGPARTYEGANEALEMLVARLAAVVDRAERRHGAPGAAAAAADGRSRQRRGWSTPLFSFGRRGVPAAYPELKSTGGKPLALPAAAPAEAESPARQIVSSVLASTAPQARGRAAKQAMRAARPVEIDIPHTIAFADAAGADLSVAPLGGAHVYRPSKLYHIYGGTVNPVARKKLEKRLRRTHTMHAMRRGARALVRPADGLQASQRGDLQEIDDLVDADPGKPRSLESAALSSSMRYDALEHLENASVAPLAPAPATKPKPKHAKAAGPLETDELGGLIAHLGEGGEAVVDTTAVQDLDLGDGPVFDRKGRQRARIAPDTQELPAAPAKKMAGAAAKQVVQGAAAAPAPKRPADSRSDKARFDRWLEHTLQDMPDTPGKSVRARLPAGAADAPAAREARAASKPAGAPAREAAPAPTAATEPPKKRAPPAHASPSRFEVTHGSVEADAEADSDDEEATSTPPGGKAHRTAAQILKEIRQQKKDDAARKEQAEAARQAREAKAAADEIERRIRAKGGSPAGETALDLDDAAARTPTETGASVAAEGVQAVALQASPKARRHRSDDLEAVLTTAEELSGELELTLDPVREEAPTAREAHAAVAELTMLDPEGGAPPAVDGPGAPGGRDEATEEAGPAGSPGASAGDGGRQGRQAADGGAPAVAEPERDVSPDDVVLAGPSTDLLGADPEESELSENDRERIRRRLQEGWNRM
ncbi:MAG TPA: hypothetical protein VGB42_05810 [Candidatus Thermoplasmatota archaeon]